MLFCKAVDKISMKNRILLMVLLLSTQSVFAGVVVLCKDPDTLEIIPCPEEEKKPQGEEVEEPPMPEDFPCC